MKDNKDQPFKASAPAKSENEALRNGGESKIPSNNQRNPSTPSTTHSQASVANSNAKETKSNNARENTRGAGCDSNSGTRPKSFYTRISNDFFKTSHFGSTRVLEEMGEDVECRSKFEASVTDEMIGRAKNKIKLMIKAERAKNARN